MARYIYVNQYIYYILMHEICSLVEDSLVVEEYPTPGTGYSSVYIYIVR